MLSAWHRWQGVLVQHPGGDRLCCPDLCRIHVNICGMLSHVPYMLMPPAVAVGGKSGSVVLTAPAKMAGKAAHLPKGKS